MIKNSMGPVFVVISASLIAAQGQLQSINNLNNINDGFGNTGIDEFNNNDQNLQQQSENFDTLNQFAGNDPFGANRLCPPVWNRMVPDFSKINWNIVDRRCEEGWWHLYPFGERYYDVDMSSRLWNDLQIDLDFFFPYYGFRFNYTFIFPEGFIAFSYPRYIQPPYEFPAPRWPYVNDPSLIGIFMAPQSFMFVGDVGISHVWYRIVMRPVTMIQQRSDVALTQGGNKPFGPVYKRANGQPAYTRYGNELLRLHDGRVEDPEMLDQITRDIQFGQVGTRGFLADYALLVTWERMGYGGAPKSTRLDLYNEVKRWQNTYQMVIATDEVRSFTMFNYANVNWTSSTAAGSLSGRGGKQSAVVGFNGGNGTGFYEMPYSAEGNSYKLVQFGSTQTAGRWQARVDEDIVYGGCTNDSRGPLQIPTRVISMLGGMGLNVSGPCFKSSYVLKMQIEELTIDCIMLDMVKARCPIPVNSMWKYGPQDIKISIDGGREYNFWNVIYILPPSLGRNQVKLINDPLESQNSWNQPEAQNLTLRWQAANITTDPNQMVDISIWGYWEDLRTHDFTRVGVIAKQTPNTGVYSFNPRQLNRQNSEMMPNAWRSYHFGAVQVRVSGDWKADKGDGIQWSLFFPLGWYYRDIWQREYGDNWATDMCIKWYEEDGKKYSFWKDLEPTLSCPCTLSQALIDKARYMPEPDCDLFGDSYCPFNPGSVGCFISVYPIWNGAGQRCCYDSNGYLMFTHDFEINGDYLRFYSAGAPTRAHMWGSYPFKRPPFVPTFSNWYNDRLPIDLCCSWAKHCEFYFWRRESSGCQDYKPGTTGFAYGDTHFITYDGIKYSFNGKGHYVLTMFSDNSHDLMVQVQMEQPPKTDWNSEVAASVITGVAMQDNGSAVVEIYAREDFRRWRYKMDVYVWGVRMFFDRATKKIYAGGGVTIYNPPYNLNTSQLVVMFKTGVGVQVTENHGVLDVMTILPYHYNESYRYGRGRAGNEALGVQLSGVGGFTFEGKCSSHLRTIGLLGTWNNDPRDELVTPDCQTVNVPDQNSPNPQDFASLYRDFGEKWRVDGNRYNLLFNPARAKGIYNPIGFANPQYRPEFDPWSRGLGNASLVLSKNAIRSQCQGSMSCEYDYLMTGRREIALDTLRIERTNEKIKAVDGQRYTSCGPLQKNEGVIKNPTGDTYLDGVTVTFSCQPKYFLHGAVHRTCVNGSWSPGWWAWCRERKLENGLKIFTGLIVSLLILLVLIAIFCWLYFVNVKGRKQRAKHYRTNQALSDAPKKPGHKVITNSFPPPPPAQRASLDYLKASPSEDRRKFQVPVMEEEPSKLGGRRESSPVPGGFIETSA